MRSATDLLGFQEADNSGVKGTSNTTSGEAKRQRDLVMAQSDNQKAFADQLYKQATGQGPSLAEAQMRAAQDRSLAQQVAMARSQRGANPGTLARQVQNNAALQGQQLVQAAGQAKLQEQQMGQQAYSNFLGGQQQYLGSLLGASQQGAQAAFQAGGANQNNQLLGNLYGMAAQGAATYASSGTNKAAQAPPVAAAQGAIIPGEPSVKGDSYANDTVNVSVSPGEAIVKRSVVEKGPEAVAKEVEQMKKEKRAPANFLEAVEHYNSAKPKQDDGMPDTFGAMLATMSDLNKRLSAMETKKGKK